MKARSTQASHWQGAIVAGARLYNGVKIDGASSNSTVFVEAFGDDTNIPINLRGKGTGNVILGNSSQATHAQSLQLNGASTFAGRAVFSSGVSVTGNSTFGAMSGAASTLASLQISGASTFAGRSVFSSGIAVTGDSTLAALNAGASTLASLTVSSNVTVGGLDAARGFKSTSYRFLIPAVGVGALEEYSLASTIADVVPGDLFSLYPTAASSLSTSLMWNYRLSTAAASRVTITFYNPHSTTATSTGSGVWQMQWVKFV